MTATYPPSNLTKLVILDPAQLIREMIRSCATDVAYRKRVVLAFGA